LNLAFGYLDKVLKHGSLTVRWPDGSSSTHGRGGNAALTVGIADRRVAFDILRNPRLGLGEAYMDGRLTVEGGTILELLELVTGANPWEAGGKSRKLIGKKGASRLKQLLRRNDPRRSRRNVAHHYDLSDELYRLFLDEDRQYSCAYYTDPGNSLEQAQADKKAHIAAKLALRPGLKVLDIGCGWGGTALYLHRVADVDVLGITLSEEQLKVARRRAQEAGVSDRVRFELVDYRAVQGPFDRIVSVGMFEHVGAPHYETFFRTCRNLLKQDGVMLLHTIGRLGAPAKKTDPFTDKYVFPGYHLPSLSEMSRASEKARLISSDVEMLRLHYAYTLRAWLERFRAARAEVEQLYDARFFRMWEFYLAGGIVMFESGSACNYQVQYIRDRRALPITRDYMAEAEARCRAAGAPDAKERPSRGKLAASA
jgi:cyclopropane-fatty-acyl-phospholipid synthase